MASIKRIRSLKGGGILSDRAAKDKEPVFAKHNLIYGFNGSGKSTLSRLFGCLQTAAISNELPEGCEFEIEMDDGSVIGSAALQGLENRVCVFNTDFVERNLQWADGRAASIFYISQDQAELANELHEANARLEEKLASHGGLVKVAAADEKTLRTFRTERARTLSGHLHLGNRRYEAGQLQADFERIEYTRGDLLQDADLEAHVSVARLSEPPPPLQPSKINADPILQIMRSARRFGSLTLGDLLLDDLEAHPRMVRWMKAGHDYYAANGLTRCLMCGNAYSESRKAALAAAFDGSLDALIAELRNAEDSAAAAREALRLLPSQWPSREAVAVELRPNYIEVLAQAQAALLPVEAHMEEARRVIGARAQQPTRTVDHSLPVDEAAADTLASLSAAISRLNEIIQQHNLLTEDFSKRQDSARLAIKKHFLAEGSDEYVALTKQAADSAAHVTTSKEEIEDIRRKAAELSAKVKTHGPAADQITKLVRAYLGHGELTVVAAEEGYELHRHNRIVEGPPSEGEKTAIALCYFLSTLEAEGRRIKDLIVVVDDPISSLDTRAMNYACALVRSRLKDAGQLFVLTHNQHCMNEFKKAWRSASEAEPPRATLLFLDVRMPEEAGRRTSDLIPMPGHLRGYDSEYHFLCHKVLLFEAAGAGHSDYWFMMPNVIRRVMELFLAFKVPGSNGLEQKLDALSKRHPELDSVRIAALGRLTQVESHTDTLEDLISHSSMTVEEAREANAALLELMEAADKDHVKAIRKQCRSPAAAAEAA